MVWRPGKRHWPGSAIIVTDLKMPRMDAWACCQACRGRRRAELEYGVVVLTAMGSIQLAVQAMKMGAYDFLPKPVDATRLKTILANATRQRDTAIELEVVRGGCAKRAYWVRWVGSSRKMREIFV